MTINEYMLRRLPQPIRGDLWVKEIYRAGGVPVDGLLVRIEDVKNSENFQKMNESRISTYEKLLGIEDVGGSLDSRRQTVEAYWKGNGYPSVSSVKAILDTYGVTGTITYSNQVLTIEFDSLPENATALQKAIRRHIPAHVILTFTTPYVTYNNFRGRKAYGGTKYKIADLETLQFKNFVG